MYSFKQYLLELFDKPYKSEYLHNISLAQQKHAKEINNGESNHKIHKLEDNNGFINTFHKDGYVEIHHLSHSGASGYISNIESRKESGNPRFYSTMIHHAKEHLEKGHGVKIKAGNHLLNKYRPIANKFNKEYKVEHHEDHILIRPHKKEIEEKFQSVKHLL